MAAALEIPKCDETEQGVVVLKKDGRKPRGMERGSVLITNSLFCKIAAKNGGQVSADALRDLYVDSGLLDEFMSITDQTISNWMPKFRLVKGPASTILDIGGGKEFYKNAEKLEWQLSAIKHSAPSMVLNLCVFVTGWTRNFLRLKNQQQFTDLANYLRLKQPKDFGETVAAMVSFCEKMEIHVPLNSSANGGEPNV